MKNFFLVINKEKIYAYAVSILTILTLFFMSSMMDLKFEETEVTSSNITENNTTYKTEENNTTNINETNSIQK